MQWAGVGMWMVLGLSACSPTKTEIGNLNVIPQPQEVSQDIQAHPFVSRVSCLWRRFHR